MGLAADHRVGPDPAVLVNRHSSGEISSIADHDVTGKHYVVGQYHVVANPAVVGYVSVDHQQVIVTDDCLVADRQAAVHRDMLSNCISMPDDKSAGITHGPLVLRKASEHDTLGNVVGVAEHRAVLDYHLALEATAVTDAHVGLDHTQRPHFHVVPKLG
jgi:hypothetical protein